MKNDDRILELLAETLQRMDRYSERFDKWQQEMKQLREEMKLQQETMQLQLGVNSALLAKIQQHDNRLAAVVGAFIAEHRCRAAESLT